MEELIAEAQLLRRRHPGCGVEKLYQLLKPDFIGRDRFIEYMMEAGFRLKRPRNYRRTTYAGVVRYPNLIKGRKIRHPYVVWQSDITYVWVGGRFYYIVFIIDVYSKLIVGYQVSRTMHAQANIKALKMALVNYPAPAIHHSDRGSQYSCREYIALLKGKQINISMGMKAQENAYAERINRTIKEEYLAGWSPDTYEALQRRVKQAVINYNQCRPHNHLNKMTPQDFEQRCLQDKTFNKPTITIFDENKSLKPVNAI